MKYCIALASLLLVTAVIASDADLIETKFPGYTKTAALAQAKLDEAKKLEKEAADLKLAFAAKWLAVKHQPLEEKPLPADPKESDKVNLMGARSWNRFAEHPGANEQFTRDLSDMLFGYDKANILQFVKAH